MLWLCFYNVRIGTRLRSISNGSFQHTDVGLEERIGLSLEPVLGMQPNFVGCYRFQGGQLPVLDLQHQDAAARMEHDEIRIAGLGADRNVAPAEVVVFEQFFQALGEAAFTGRIELALAASGKKAGHRSSIPRCGSRVITVICCTKVLSSHVSHTRKVGKAT